MNTIVKLFVLSVLTLLAGAVAAPSTRADDPTTVCNTYKPGSGDGEPMSAICSASTEDATNIYAYVSAQSGGNVRVEVSDHGDCGSGRTVACEVALTPLDIHYYSEDKTIAHPDPIEFVSIVCACFDEDNLPASGFVD